MAFSHASILHNVLAAVVWGPTALSGSSPYYTGGTVLGYTESGVEVGIKQEWVEVRGEESGAELLDLRYAGTDVSCAMTLKQWDDAALAIAFPGGLTATGSTSSTKNVVLPGTLTLGSPGRDNAGVLLCVPVDITNGKILLMRKAIPRADQALRLQMKLRSPNLLAVAFHGVQDTSIASGNARYASRNTFIGNYLDTSI